MFNVHESSDLLLDEVDTSDDADDELLDDEDKEEKEEGLDSKDAWGLEEEFE